MKSSPLLSKPDFVPQFNAIQRPEYEAVVVERVREYYLARWPWTSEKKETYLKRDEEAPVFFWGPRTPEDRAELLENFTFFFFPFDDITETMPLDKLAKTVEGLKRAYLDGQPPQNPWENIMYDLRTRMLSIGDGHSRELVNNIFVHTATYMETISDQDRRRKASKQGLDEYLKFRHVDVGLSAFYAMFTWGLEHELGTPSARLQSDLDYGILSSLAGDHMVLINDMYSYRREMLLLESQRQQLVNISELRDEEEYLILNAICVLLREDGVDETNVMDRLGAHIYRRESDFLATAEKLRLRYQDRVEDLVVIEEWVAALKDMMAGNYVWSSTCRRYNNLVKVVNE